jgi:hypothetical protein
MQSVCFAGSGICLLALAAVSSYEASLVLLTLVLACNAFHNAGVLVNAQDIAPNYAGSVFGALSLDISLDQLVFMFTLHAGVMSTAGAVPGIVGVYVVGHVLHTTHSWATVFVHTGLLCFLGLGVFLAFGSGKPIVVKD